MAGRLILTSILVALAGCASTAPGKAHVIAAGLPTKFDLVCKVAGGSPERISVDLDQNLWASNEYPTPAPIDAVEPSRIVFEQGATGSDFDHRSVDLRSGVYYHQVNIGEPVLSYAKRGRCSVEPFTSLETSVRAP